MRYTPCIGSSGGDGDGLSARGDVVGRVGTVGNAAADRQTIGGKLLTPQTQIKLISRKQGTHSGVGRGNRVEKV